MSPAPGCVPTMLNTVPGPSKPFQWCHSTALTVSLILGLPCFCNSEAVHNPIKGLKFQRWLKSYAFVIAFLIFFFLPVTLGLTFSPIESLLDSYAWLPWAKQTSPWWQESVADITTALNPLSCSDSCNRAKTKMCYPGGNWQLGKHTLTYRHNSILWILNTWSRCFKP